MIPLPIEQISVVFVTMWVVIISVLWFHDEYKGASMDWTTAKNHLYVCSKCHFSFLAKDDSENITRCPNCNEMCFLKRKSKL